MLTKISIYFSFNPRHNYLEKHAKLCGVLSDSIQFPKDIINVFNNNLISADYTASYGT